MRVQRAFKFPVDLPCHTLNLGNMTWIKDTVRDSAVRRANVESEHKFAIGSGIWFARGHDGGSDLGLHQACGSPAFVGRIDHSSEAEG